MVLEYFSLKRGDKKPKEAGVVPKEKEPADTAVKSPILDDDDEKFLRDLAEEDPPPLPARLGTANKESTLVPENIALPTSPAAGPENASITPQAMDKTTTEAAQKKKNRMSSYFDETKNTLGRSLSVFGKGKDKAKAEITSVKESKSKKETASNITVSAPTADKAEATEEEDDLAGVLDQLNLSAVNNRVFSFSKESQKLLDDFKVVLKDLVNGVPTAYDDLEKLLTNSEDQLKKMFEGMPPFMRSLIKQLPAKISAALGPEVLAAAAEKPGADGSHLNPGTASKIKRSVPSLKSLVSAQGAIATMLRSILNFLKLRFPAVLTGTNVLLSLAVFILLFVFWYCHKRGREVRLEKERSSASATASDASDSEVEDSIILTPTNYYEESLKKAAAEKAVAESNAESSAGPATNDPHVERVIKSFPSTADLPAPANVPLPAPTPREEKAKEPALESD